VPASLVAKYFSNNIGITFIFVAFAISAVLIVRYAPKNSPLNQISEKRVKTLRVLSIVTLSVWFIISVCLYLFQQAELAVSVCFGILLEVSSIVPLFEKLYDRLNTIGAKR
jgi:accessory gene regulator protein AgrB